MRSTRRAASYLFLQICVSIFSNRAYVWHGGGVFSLSGTTRFKQKIRVWNISKKIIFYYFYYSYYYLFFYLVEVKEIKNIPETFWLVLSPRLVSVCICGIFEIILDVDNINNVIGHNRTVNLYTAKKNRWIRLL